MNNDYEFEIGQPAFDSFRFAGWEGVVKDMSWNGIWVEYPGYQGDRHFKAMYGIDGRYIDTDAFPTLYTHPYTFEVKEVSQFTKGELILHRNNEAHPWNIGIYIEKTDFNYYHHKIKSFGQMEAFARFIISLKGNESKLWKN